MRTEHEKILVLGGTLGLNPEAMACAVNAGMVELIAAAHKQDAEAIRALLKTLVPEYAPGEV